ncbi:hypothetical protein ACJMK2_042498 [Sinanodonta woodiana]|uniref:WAP domain-containing protein n=1 Tax=Sinanodonta woodiana TaxID=1069815 RepID=A0ABD3W7I9_SINWO
MKEIIIVLLFLVSVGLAKPGLFPRRSGFVELCSSDSDCSGSQKCCSKVCRHTCQTPTTIFSDNDCDKRCNKNYDSTSWRARKYTLPCIIDGITYHTGDGFIAGDGCNMCGCNNGIAFCTLMACVRETDMLLNKTIV